MPCCALCPAPAAAADLIALLTLYNAFFAIIGVWLIDGRIPAMSEMPNFPLFCKVAVATATMGLTAAVLYQRALSIAPLSLTVPYLAFAPVFVVSVWVCLCGELHQARASQHRQLQSRL